MDSNGQLISAEGEVKLPFTQDKVLLKRFAVLPSGWIDSEGVEGFMKRFLACILAITLLITVFPLAGLAAPTVTYTKDDVMSAVSGVGRTPSNWYNWAGIALETLGDITEAQAESLTKKLYTIWALLEKYTYTIDINHTLQEVLTSAQWTALTNYLYVHDQPALNNLFLNILTTMKPNILKKGSVPLSLLGVQFDDATAGVATIVKVYTTTDIASGVYITDARGHQISTGTVTSTYAGTLASFNEHIVTITYPYAGRISVRICGVDSKYHSNYYNDTVLVSKAPIHKDPGTTTEVYVIKATAGSAALGTTTEFTVTTNQDADMARISDSKGEPLAVSSTYTEDPAKKTRTFKLYYSFPSIGKYTVRAYAGLINGPDTLWSKKYKTLKATVVAPASSATISKATATRQYRGEPATVTVYASTSTTRVRLFDSSNDLVDLQTSYTLSGKYRVFKLTYDPNTAGNLKVYAQAGNALDWNSKRQLVVVTFAMPYVASASATTALRGTASTITVTGSKTATSARLLDSNMNVIETKALTGGTCTFAWPQNTAGKKTVYAQVNDGYGWSSSKSVRVTFTNPTISVSTTKVPAGTQATITVTASSTVTKVQFYTNPKASPFDEKDSPDSFVFHWTSTKGKKTIYFKIWDGIGWSGFIKSYVTFT
jgi:hypothetical protein